MDKSQNSQSALLAIAVVLALGVGFGIGYQVGFDNGGASVHGSMHHEMMDMGKMMGHSEASEGAAGTSVENAMKTIDAAGGAAHAH